MRTCSLLRLLSVCVAATLLIACSGERAKAPALPSGSKEDAGPEAPDTHDPRVDAGVDPLAPIVQFVAPNSATDPNADVVVTAPTLNVRCSAARSNERGSAALDKSSVKITLEQVEDPTKLIMPPVNAMPNDEYQATFDLGGRPNGRLRFHCSARDVASKARTTMATLDTMLDLGPSIEIVSPNAKIYTLKTPVPIEFKIRGVGLTADDTEHTVQNVKLLVGGVETPVQESTMTPGLYQTSVDFDDRAQFPVPPTSAQIAVSASNLRTPMAPTREAKVDIAIDGDGPTIVVEAPGDGELVHGERELRVNVSDPSGILASSLVADINQGLHVIRDWQVAAPVFKQRFDTRKFGTELTQLTINVTASDSVGNTTTVGLRLKLDNLPPVISLDPPFIRAGKRPTPNTFVCSALFDPVGDEPPNDLEPVVNIARYRALVEDKTNAPLTDQRVVKYLAGTNKQSVELFMQRDPSIPLLIDTDDEDHFCDEINHDQLEMKLRPTKLQLNAVNPTDGKPYFPRPTSADSFGCYDPSGDASDPDEDICSTQMPRIVSGRIQGNPPAVYAIRPSNTCNAGEYAGEYWELLSIAREGWICLAARAEDTIGNIGVSAPLRVCWDDPRTAEKPVCDPKATPSCTDGCIINVDQLFGVNEIWTP